MWLDEVDLSKRDLVIDPPLVNAAGTMGFYPNPKSINDWHFMGAFITNPVSFNPRKPAETRACVHYASGFLLHSGLPNPGFKAVLKRYQARWAKAPLPVIVHLMAEEVDSLRLMIRQLESIENVIGVELGFTPQMHVETVNTLLASANSELPVVLGLNPQQVSTYVHILQEGTVAMVRISEPRGMLPTADGQLLHGRLFGPAVFAETLSVVHTLAGEGLKVIGGGGVYTMAQVKAMRQAGAVAVALDAVLWRGGLDLTTIAGV